MRWIALVVVLAPLIALIVGTFTGRVQARSCCCVADPRRDLRMAGVFDDVDAPGSGPAPTLSPEGSPARTAR